ncbi:MAG: hypothetical protein KBT40_00720 [bacterium]|nr:hypothetical protein [Candidatus Minthenecus merdequi]
MRTISLFFAMLMSAFGIVTAQTETVTVQATDNEVAENLDLEAVARAFGECENLEEFERVLNDPRHPLSNLDLNMDGYVDYLRVSELAENYNHLVVIQAVLGNDLFQDVASISVETTGTTRESVTVIVTGDPYIYGVDYVFVPVYAYRPLIYDWWWGPVYHGCYISPWYWGYYPHYYYHYPPCAYGCYRGYVTDYRWRYAAPVYDRHSRRTADPAWNSRRGEISRRDYARSYETHSQRISATGSRSGSSSSSGSRVASGSRNGSVSVGSSRRGAVQNVSRSGNTQRVSVSGGRAVSSTPRSGSTGTTTSGTRSTTTSDTRSTATNGTRSTTTSGTRSGSTSTTTSTRRVSGSASGNSSTKTSSTSSSYRPNSSTSTRTSSTRTSSSSSTRSGGYSSGGSRGGSSSGSYSGGSRGGGSSAGTRTGGGSAGGGRRR